MAKVVKDNRAVFLGNADYGNQLFQRDYLDVMSFWNGPAVRLEALGLPTKSKMIKNGITVGVSRLSVSPCRVSI